MAIRHACLGDRTILSRVFVRQMLFSAAARSLFLVTQNLATPTWISRL